MTALAALAIAVVAVIAGFTQNLGLVLGAAVCLAVLGVAGWYIVTRSHAARTAAIVVAAVSVAGFVALILAADVDWRLVATSVVAAAVSVAAARVALRPSDEERLVAMVGAAPPAERAVLIMNPRSGGGKVERFQLVDECRRRGIDPVLLNPGDDLVQLAEEAIARGADVIGMAGGDGSQALVAGIASRHGIPMVVIPAGTRNHFALDIGLDRNDVVGALDAYAEGLERRIDLATVNGRVFVNNASLGLYARIVQSPGYRDAKLHTTADMLPQMLGPGAAPFDLRYTGPDGTEHPTAHLVMVSNNPYHLESLQQLGTRERLDGGVLGMATAIISNLAEWNRFLALETTGRLDRFAGMLQWTAPEFEIRSDEPVEIGIDGEALVMDAPLVFRSMPGALRLLVPLEIPGAPGAKRRARLLSGSTVADLGRVAAGRPPEGGRP